jgi:CelD/BcsL family acetyltransferase involved in cellulose biosynthesis
MNHLFLSFDELGVEALREWSALISATGANPTLSHDWLRVSMSALARPDENIQVCVFRGPDGALRGLLPFYHSRTRMLGLGMKQLELGSNFMSYHATLLAPGFECPALDTLLRGIPGWDIFRASNIVTGSPAAMALEEIGAQMGLKVLKLAGESSPYLRISSGWEEFLATRNKKFRYKFKKRHESISADASCQLVWYTSREGVERLLADMLTIERASWKVGEGTDIGSRDQEVRYHNLLLPALAGAGWLLGLVLYKSGQPIAYSLCCHADGWFGHMKTSFDSAYAELSPGAIVIDASVEKAFALRAREFDFLGDAAQHKLAWTSTVRQHTDYLLFARSLKPRLVAMLKTLRSGNPAGRRSVRSASAEASLLGSVAQ